MKRIKAAHTPLPSNQEAEIAILGGVLLKGAEVYEKAKTWIKDDNAFYVTSHKNIWMAISVFYKEDIPIDTLTVHTELKKTR